MTEREIRISDWLDGRRGDFIRDLSMLAAIESTESEARPGMPFGPGPAEALEAAMGLCEGYGLAVRNYEGYVATADLNGGERALDILAHLDVVLAGEGWDTDPYTPVMKEDGCLYGRGTSDDKGGLLAALYAMLCVRDLGLPITKNVRLIMGTNEESGSGDIAYYYNKEKSAPCTFSPDAEFPVYNTEKGSFHPVFSKSWAPCAALPRVEELRGGIRINVIPADAQALVLGLEAEVLDRALSPLAAEAGVGLRVERAPGGARVFVTGKGGHASIPEDSTNGITALTGMLACLPLAPCASTEAIGQLAKFFPHGDGEGRAVGIAMADEISGPLSMAFTLLTLDGGGLRGELDCRVPVCADEENCRDVFTAALGRAGFSVESTMRPPHHTPADTPFIRTLLRSYETYTGLKGECLAMGGGTYVHNVPGGVAFGAGIPGFEPNCHGANEKADISQLLTAAKVFALAIADICQ